MHSIVIRESLLFAFEEALGRTDITEPMGTLPEGSTVINQENQVPINKEGKVFHMIYDPDESRFGFVQEEDLLIFNKI